MTNLIFDDAVEQNEKKINGWEIFIILARQIPVDLMTSIFFRLMGKDTIHLEQVIITKP